MENEEKKPVVNNDETSYVETSEIREVLNEQQKEKKESWLKRLFKRKKNK